MFSKLFLFYEILLIFIKQSLINTKNIILNINRISFQNFIGENKIDDFINYDIYTEIEVGTPPQQVTHFIEPNDKIFQFKKRDINYNTNKFNNSVNNFFETRLSLFNSSKSSSYKGSFSDNFIFNNNDNNNNNKKIQIKNLNFTIYYNNRNNENKYGIIGLQTMGENSGSFQELYSFINQLKFLNIINDYSFCFLYNDKNNLFQSDINLGKIIIGENPIKYNDNKDNEEDEIKIYSASNDIWTLMSDEIKFDDYVENNIQLNFDFNSKFIKGSKNFNKKIKKFFFDELIENNLCKNETVSENKYIFNYEIYSCYNNSIIREKIKKFPKLNFINKNSNIIFSFDYNDLFQIFPDKNKNQNLFYFMIIFRTDKYNFLTNTWLIGEIFLKKYIANFNLESKSISYYKSQIYKTEENLLNNGNKKSNNILRIIIEILMGIIIILCFYLLYRKYKKSRKLLANELEDNNYAYISNEQELNNS